MCLGTISLRERAAAARHDVVRGEIAAASIAFNAGLVVDAHLGADTGGQGCGEEPKRKLSYL